MSIRDARALALFELAKARPAGVTIDQIARHLGVPYQEANHVVRHLRRHLGKLDSIWLVATPQGKGERWLYSLSGVAMLDAADPDGRWITNRVRDAETRIEIMLSMMDAAVRGTNGRTVEGRKARVMQRAFTRLREDFAEIDGRLFP